MFSQVWLVWHRLAWPTGISVRTGQYGSVCLAFYTSVKGKAHLSRLRYFLYSFFMIFILCYLVFIEVSDGAELLNLTQNPY